MDPSSPIAPFSNTHALFEPARTCMTTFNGNPCTETLTPYWQAVMDSGKNLKEKKALIADKELSSKIDELYISWLALHTVLKEISSSPDLVKCTQEKTVLLLDTWKQVNRKCVVINALAKAKLGEYQPTLLPVTNLSERTPLLFSRNASRNS